MFGAMSLLLSTAIVASCIPISPISFPLSGGPTPPLAGPALAAPQAATDLVDAPVSTAVSPTAVASTALTATAEAPVRTAGLGGMAGATVSQPALAQQAPQADEEPAPPDGDADAAASSGDASAPGQAVVPKPVTPINPITMAAAVDCLTQGDVVYALALQNTNVRQAAGTSACRIGRIPRGTLVRITAADGVQVAAAAPAVKATPAATAAAASVPAAATGVGYIEDVLPILQRNCNTCHSGVAKIQELQVTSYAGIMQGSIHGPVVLPGDSTGSLLWQMVSSGKMPVIGTLTSSEKSLIKQWIDLGANENRPVAPAAPATAPGAQSASAPSTAPAARNALWLDVDPADVNAVTDSCAAPLANPQHVVSAQLMLPVVCAEAPDAVALDRLRSKMGLPVAGKPSGLPVAAAPVASADEIAATASVSATAETTDTATAPTDGATVDATAAVTQSAAPVAPVQAAFAAAAAGGTGITAPALGLDAPTDADPWLTPRGGLCIDRKLPNNDRGITALTFAPDGRLFLAFDSKLTGQDVDQIILYDAFHPSRSIGVIDSVALQGLTEIMQESSRITGMDWQDGTLYISRAGEVGAIADGGAYEPLASGFAVNGQLFHANNGLVISDGWLYVSAGGVRDGYSDGPIVGIGEDAAQQTVSGGNAYAARIVRAPLSALLSQRSISAFSTAARGTRNPYGITADATGRIWFTDNGATNVPEDVSAGDEVNVLSPATIGGGEANTPYYGFPLAITQPQDWYTRPAVVLPNTAAPTGITWALGTIYYAQYGKDPGLYRLGVAADGTLVSERVMLGWPILALATAPDGALWLGMGDGSLFRITTGC